MEIDRCREVGVRCAAPTQQASRLRSHAMNIKDYREMAATIALPSINVEITLAEIYRGVTFDEG